MGQVRFAVAASFVALALVGCAAPVEVEEESVGQAQDALEATSNWAQFGRSPRRTSFAEDEQNIGRSNVATLVPAWTLVGDNIREARLAVWNKRVFVTNPDRYRKFPTTEEYSLLSAYDVCDGSVLWSMRSNGEFSGFVNDPAVGDGWLYAQDENRTGAFRTTTGAAQTVQGGPGMDFSMSATLVARGARYFESYDNEGDNFFFSSTEIPSGNRWRLSLGFPFSALRTPSYANDLVWVASGEQTQLQAYDAATGGLARETTAVAELLGSASIYKGRVLAAARNVVYAFDERTGAVAWRGTYTGAATTGFNTLQPPAVDGSGVLVTAPATTGVRVAGFDLETGARRFEVTIGTAPQSGHIAVANGVLFLGTSDGHLYAVHTGTGAMLADFTFSKPVGSPAIANGRVFVPYSPYSFSALTPEGESGGGVVALALPGSSCATP
ncbi:MAG: hypothetical protein EOO73_24265 [Myxococcales bacterium]|nr:MAG: hypothetical protein EOO73_24265 [Myxococcales bacterium]